MYSKYLTALVVVLLLLTAFIPALGFGFLEDTTQIDLPSVEAYLETPMQRHRLKGKSVAITQGKEIVYL